MLGGNYNKMIKTLQIMPHGSQKHHRVLRYQCQAASKGVEFDFADVAAIDLYASSLQFDDSKSTVTLI